MHRRFRVLFGLLMLLSGGCRNEPPPGEPLSKDELAQFDDPLSLSSWQEPGSWPQFAHDPLHSGGTDVEFGSADLELAWSFRPAEYVWSYQPGFSVWSSPVVGTVGGRSLVIAGYYDRNVYAVDGVTGRQAWVFRPGVPVFATPALGRVGGQDLVFVASLNRSVYGLDAATGEQRWRCETAEWSFTQARSLMSSPTMVTDEDASVLVIGVWNSDSSPGRNYQMGELIAIDAGSGTVRWRQALGSVPLSSPAVARLDGELTVFVASQDGMVHALRLADGFTRWKSVLNEETQSSPSVGVVDGAGRVLIGTRLNTLFALDARTGRRTWRQDAGYWIDSTPAWLSVPAATGGSCATSVVVGSYDCSFYAWALTGTGPQWKAATGNFAYSSAAVARLNGMPAVFAMSWDENSYLFDGQNGRVLWQAGSGPMLWSHTFMGDSLWGSPAVASVDGAPTVIIPALDGVLYAYRPRSAGASQPASAPG